MLRPFSAFNTYVLYIPALNTPTNQAFKIQRIDFNNAGATDRWLQIFSGVAIPANATVPLVAATLMQAAFSGSAEDLLPDGFNVPAPGVVIVVSSTQATLTKDVAATCDITAYVEEFETVPPGTSVAGDNSTPVNQLAVWTDANGPKALFRLELTNSSATPMYAAVYAINNPLAGEVRVNTLLPIPAKVAGVNGSIVYTFGPSGMSPFQKDASGVLHDACTIFIASAVSPGSLDGGTPATIRATYK